MLPCSHWSLNPAVTAVFLCHSLMSLSHSLSFSLSGIQQKRLLHLK